MKLLGIVAAAAVALYLGVTLAFPSYTHRYRLTIEIDTPQGVRSGSSVVAVTRKDVRWILIAQGRYEFSTHGEAPFIDLGDNRHAIAVMAHGPRAEDVDQMTSMPIEAYGYYRWDEAAWTGRVQMKGPVELKTPLIPTIVTFADRSDARSAKVVFGSGGRESVDRFAEQFNVGVKFKRAWIETTGEPISQSIETKIPEIIHQLRDDAKVMRLSKVGDPYRAALGHFIRK